MGKLICSVDGCLEVAHGRGMCNIHYQRWYKTGSTDVRRRPSFAERFWAKVDRSGPVPAARSDLGPCWLWTAAKDHGGYGKFFVEKINGKARLVQAYRIAYQLEVGPIPDDMAVDHLCRTPACVNPAHLEPVTQRENLWRGNVPDIYNWRATHCPQGHPYDNDNTYWYGNNRKCRKCRIEAGRRSRARKRAREQSAS